MRGVDAFDGVLGGVAQLLRLEGVVVDDGGAQGEFLKGTHDVREEIGPGEVAGASVVLVGRHVCDGRKASKV